MKISTLAASAALCLAAASVGTSAFATTWAIDPGHSAVAFKINHLGFSNVHGLIPNLEGSFDLDDAKPEAAKFEVHVPVANLTTGNPKRDEHLRSPDFFNQKQFANIEIKGKSAKKKGDGFEVSADLTMKGVTKPITFVFKRMKTGKDPWGNTRTGGETTFKLKRTDYGVSFMSKPGEIGDEVELQISLEAVQK